MSERSRQTQRRDIVDWDEALARVGGSQETLQEMVDLFLEHYPDTMEEIKESIEEDDGPRLRRAAHTLKGSASIFGATSVTEPAAELSEKGKQEDFENTGDMYWNLQKHVLDLARELQTH